MTEVELLKLIEGGENIQVEFKKSTTEITKDVYDTVCSFSNRDGGTIVLGVNFGHRAGCSGPHEKGLRDFHQQRAENQSTPLFAAGNLYGEWPHTAGHSGAVRQPGLPPSRAHF